MSQLDESASPQIPPFARLDIRLDTEKPSNSRAYVVVGSRAVAQLPVNTVDTHYEHQNPSGTVVKVGMYRADVDFKGIKGQ